MLEPERYPQVPNPLNPSHEESVFPEGLIPPKDSVENRTAMTVPVRAALENASAALERLFAGAVEHALCERGIADPLIGHYLSRLLVSRCHTDSLVVRDPRDQAMYSSLSAVREALYERPFHEPHVFLFCRDGGDFALFTAGFLCPESRRRSATELRTECTKTGQSLFRIASQAPDETFEVPSKLLADIGHEIGEVIQVLRLVSVKYFGKAA